MGNKAIALQNWLLKLALKVSLQMLLDTSV